VFELKRILVPLDGSSLAERALPLATTLAQQFRSQIILLHVLQFFRIVRGAYQKVYPAREVEAQNYSAYQEAEAYLQARQDELRAQGFDVALLLRGTKPNEEVSDVITAQKVDLIVMATHARGGLARWASGSVADEVVRRSGYPVLLVRQSETDESKGDGKRVTDDGYRLRNGSQHRFPMRGVLLPEHM